MSASVYEVRGGVRGIYDDIDFFRFLFVKNIPLIIATHRGQFLHAFS